MRRLDPEHLPAPRSAHSAALSVDTQALLAIRGRRARRPRRITWRGILYMFLPYLVAVTIIVAAALTWKGFTS